ncbi:MAG: element excision factor XisI family protein [Microcystis sp. LE17-20A]|nr:MULTISPECIES: element excision factor XisI family protein [Microcystis]MCZ8038396.1 element excision factor XisI family protein [Microcystis sp. LE17-20A]MCZ8056448.1 element excision factor XisI family protein [Microcystis sp. LE19-12.2C]MCZ8211349.1 element excision factor XisI family protein [Microcystis sp. LE19-8.1F]
MVFSCTSRYNNKIWVQHDGTEAAIADKLVARGVPKQDIVLAYHGSPVRQYSEFALG